MINALGKAQREIVCCLDHMPRHGPIISLACFIALTANADG